VLTLPVLSRCSRQNLTERRFTASTLLMFCCDVGFPHRASTFKWWSDDCFVCLFFDEYKCSLPNPLEKSKRLFACEYTMCIWCTHGTPAVMVTFEYLIGVRCWRTILSGKYTTGTSLFGDFEWRTLRYISEEGTALPTWIPKWPSEQV